MSDMAGETGESTTLLIVEDEFLVRFSTAEFFRARGFAVIDVSSAEEAIAVLINDSAISFVFSDIGMPGGMTGMELAQWVKRHRPAIAVIITSGDPASARSALSDPGLPFIAKPYFLPDVERRIRAFLQQEKRGEG